MVDKIISHPLCSATPQPAAYLQTQISLSNQKARQNLVITSTPRPLTIISMASPKLGGKAKKVTGMIKLALEAGKATPSPPVGPAFGSKSVNASDRWSPNARRRECIWSV